MAAVPSLCDRHAMMVAASRVAILRRHSKRSCNRQHDAEVDRGKPWPASCSSLFAPRRCPSAAVRRPRDQ
jgi:hypothetical protein